MVVHGGKMSSFDAIFKAVKKDCKKDPLATLHKPGDISIKSYIPWGILTGLPELDLHIGKPGWPAGRVIEMYGFEHCGKTTLAYHAISQAQLAGGSAYFIDTEKSWDAERAAQCGVEVDNRLGIGDADSVDAAFRMAQSILVHRKENNDGEPFIIAIDSVTGAATESMRAKTIGAEERVGQDARAIRGGMRRIGPDIAETNTTLIMINHATANITANKYAKQSDSSGGHSIKLAASVRCAMKSAGWIKDKDDVTGMRLGQKISIAVEKLKGSRLDYPEVKDTPLLNTIGFDTQESLLRAGCQSGWVSHTKGSKDYSMGEQTFSKAAWPDIVFQCGGIDNAYKAFIEWCIEDGCISPWGAV
jgi:recombination protein RecA